MNMRASAMVVAALACAGSASASVLLKPNGNFTGGGQFADRAGVRFRAFNAEYVNSGAPAGLTEALRAQNFNWTTGANLSGDFRLDQNQSWVVTDPAQNFYGYNFAAANRGELGGNAFAVGYVPGRDDPVAADARWLQVIRTNDPLGWGVTHGIGLVADVGMTWYIDNGWRNQPEPPTDPFYGANDNVNNTGYAANGLGLIDSPSRDIRAGIWWEAWAFIATRDARGDLTVYDGVHWGFETFAVPSPGSLAMVLLGGIVCGRRRRM
ncbi:MAG: hypothetical protein AABZ53_00770 [Planctomycetota bacterium]